MGKKALAAVSFGTSYPAARGAIARIEETLAAARPEHRLFRAFTSGMVADRIEREEGVRIPNPTALLERLACEGYDEVLCQSLHVIPGYEYEKLKKAIEPFETRFAKLTLGKPLLWNTQDYLRLARALLPHMPRRRADEAFIWMGHGTDHPANAAYALMENTFRFEGAERVYVAAVEGFPNFDYVLRRLRRHGVTAVHLAPLMVVAGDHAQNDLAGAGEDSWKSILESEGYSVRCGLRGLGEYDEIASLFAAHLPA